MKKIIIPIITLSMIAAASFAADFDVNSSYKISAEAQGNFLKGVEEACNGPSPFSASSRLKMALQKKCADEGIEQCEITSMTVVNVKEDFDIKNEESLMDFLFSPIRRYRTVLVPNGYYTCTMQGFARRGQQSEAVLSSGAGKKLLFAQYNSGAEENSSEASRAD